MLVVTLVRADREKKQYVLKFNTAYLTGEASSERSSRLLANLLAASPLASRAK